MGLKESLTERSLLLGSQKSVVWTDPEHVLSKPKLGLVNGVSLIVGAILGTGIFVSPKGVLSATGSLGMSLVVWCSSGLISMVGALCYIELGTSIPKSGCDFTYIQTAFGQLPAFLCLWVFVVIIGPVNNIICALTFANYALQPFFPCCFHTPEGTVIVAVIALKEPEDTASVETPDPSSERTVILKKRINLLHGVGFILGTAIGTGIFITPLSVLKNSGSVGFALVVWVLSGVVTMIGAACYLELGMSMPRSGSNFIYLETAYGSLPAFLYLWMYLVNRGPSLNAISAHIFAIYVLDPLFRDCEFPRHLLFAVAFLITCLLTFINCHNVEWATRVQDVFTLTKVLALLVIILAGVYHMSMGNVQNFENAFEGTITDPGRVALSFYSGLYSYAGWNFLNFVTEELKDPFKNLPRAIYISLPLVTVIYVLGNVAYFAVLTPDEILSSRAVAVTFGDKILGSMAWIMPLSVALSTFGGLNGNIFASARLFFVGAREGHLPASLAMIHVEHYTPTASLIFLCTLSLLYLSTTDVYALINYTAFAESLFVTFSVAGLLWLRYKRPDMERPIKVRLFLPIIFLIVCIFLVTLPFYVSPWETGMGLAITLSGIPVYFVTIYWQNKPRLYKVAIAKVTRIIQMLLLSVPEEKPVRIPQKAVDEEEDASERDSAESNNGK